MASKEILGLFVVLMCLDFEVNGFPSGAPPATCIDIFPRHWFPPVKRDDPKNGKYYAQYKIDFNDTMYEPGKQYTITISGPKFAGFILKAERESGDTEIGQGSFSGFPENTKGISWYPEKAKAKNCFTHKYDSAFHSLPVQWTAPANSAGDLILRATFVKEFNEIFYDIRLKVPSKTQATNAEWNGVVSELKEPPKLNDIVGKCGNSMGCLLYPKFCVTFNRCTHVLAWKKNDTDATQMVFEMAGIVDPSVWWIAMGIQNEAKVMNGTQVHICMKTQAGNMSITNGQNPTLMSKKDGNTVYKTHTTSLRNSIGSMSNFHFSKEDDVIYCKFQRPTTMAVPNLFGFSPITYDLTKEVYLFLGYGRLVPGTDVIGLHIGYPVISDTKVDLKENTLYYGITLPLKIRLHGCLMVVAWVLFVGVGMTIARFYKDVLGRKVQGIKMWFHMHRTMQFFVFTCAIAAFIIILIHVEGWKDEATLHGAFGVVCMILSLLQVCSGFCRPHLDSPKRPRFNWFHFICGNLTLIFAVVTIVLTYFMDFVLPPSMRMTTFCCALIYIGIHYIISIILEVIRRKGISARHQAEKYKKSDDDLMEIADSDPDLGPTQYCWGFLRASIVIYSIIVILISIVFMVVINIH